MSRRRAYSEETLAIMERFFNAVEAVVQKKAVRNLSTFLVDNRIDRRHFYTQRTDHSRGFFEVSWLLPLIRDCNVSADWLLFGKGDMFVSEQKPKPHKNIRGAEYYSKQD